MKKKIYIIAVLVVAMFSVLWLWPRNEQPAPATSQATPPKTPPAASVAAGATVTPEDLAKTPWTGTDEQKRGRILEVREIVQQANQPISFYGQVIDQDNAPLPGVKVRFSVKYTQSLIPGTARDVFDYVDQITDAQGLFSLTGKKGALLSVETMQKEGYEAGNVSGRPYWYAPPISSMRFTPNEKQPEIFRMWKLAGAEPLLYKGIGTGIPYDGSTVIFDLQTGREVKSGGDIKVTLLRTPLQIKPQEKYDWTATIEAVDGGVIVSTDELMYRAPESGYETKLTIGASANDAKWSTSKSVSFYLKSRGLYARVQAKFMTDSYRSDTGFRISAYINPKAGSRNLEYDPLQNVAKP
ncbi:MAG: hypothetical protein RL376_707 [Verrucomicrobiota bacterium]|jgi:hypothetical protein